jgi:anti-sigma factor RsiW
LTTAAVALQFSEDLVMQHTQAIQLFGAYMGHELQPEAERELEAHLGDCPVCQRELDSMSGSVQHTVEMLAKVPKAAAPPDFLRRVQHRIRTRTRGRYFGPASMATRVPFEVVSFALIVMVMALYVLMLLNGPVAPR